MKSKFVIMLLMGGLCLFISPYLAIWWIDTFFQFSNVIYVWWVGIALLPGFLMFTMLFSNIYHFKNDKYKNTWEPTTSIFFADNEEENVERSIKCICTQNYIGDISFVWIRKNPSH